MAFKVFNRIKQSFTTAGTGTITLGAASLGYTTVASRYTDGDTLPYLMEDPTTGAWEVGYGTVGGTGTTIARTIVKESSNADAAVNWASGTKTFAVCAPANDTVTQPHWARFTTPENVTIGSSGNTLPTVSGDAYMAMGHAADASATAAIALGTQATASAEGAVVVGGINNDATAECAGVLGGTTCAVNAEHGGVLAGEGNTVGNAFSGIVAGKDNFTGAVNQAILAGRNAYDFLWPASRVTGAGVMDEATTQFWSQHLGATAVVGAITTDATQTDMAFNNDYATHKLNLAPGVWFVDGLVAARSVANDVKTWTVRATIKVDGSGNAAFVDTSPVVTLVDDDAGAATWALALAIGTTGTDHLRVRVTGQAATTIEWVARLNVACIMSYAA